MSPPVLSPWPSAPGLVVSVEIGVDAPGGVPAQRRTVSCGPALGRVQQICERFGVRPTYLVGMQAHAVTHPTGERQRLGDPG